MIDKPPSPGSDEAKARGCTCPVMDNAHGKGVPHSGGVIFWFDETCPIHSWEVYPAPPTNAALK